MTKIDFSSIKERSIDDYSGISNTTIDRGKIALTFTAEAKLTCTYDENKEKMIKLKKPN